MIVGGMKRPWRHLPALAASANPKNRIPPHLCVRPGPGHLGPSRCQRSVSQGASAASCPARGAVVPKARRSQHERAQALQPAVQFFGHHVVMRVPVVTQPEHGGGLPGQQVGGKGAAEQPATARAAWAGPHPGRW